MRSLPIIILILFTSTALAQETDQKITPEDEAKAMEFYIDGLNEFANENFEEALDLLSIAYLKLADHAGVNYALADAYLAVGDLINAAYYGNTAIELEPDNKWYYLKQAEIYRQLGRTEATLEVLEQALEYHPNDLNILLRLGALYSNFSEYERSNDIYDKVLSIRGGDFDIHHRKYRNYKKLNQKEAALNELNRMRALEPDNIQGLHTLSQLYLDLEEDSLAMDVLQAAKKRNPRNPETLILLADIYIQEAKWDSLGNTFLSMIEDPLLSPDQKMDLARFLYLQEQSSGNQEVLTHQTRRVLERFSEIEQDYGRAHLLAADFYLNHNETSAAVEKLELVNLVMPSEAEAWQQRLQLMFGQQRYDEVIEVGNQATEYISDDAFIQFFVGASYMLTDRHQLAVEWLENATLAPARRNLRSIIYGSLGDALTELDRWDDAVEAYETALQLDGQNHNAMNNFAYYLSVREERLEFAEELALRALELEPENAAYLDTAGWVYYQKGNYDKAYEYVKSAIDTGDASAEVLEHMGDILEKLDKPEEARIWYQKAHEKDPDRTHLNQKIDIE